MQGVRNDKKAATDRRKNETPIHPLTKIIRGIQKNQGGAFLENVSEQHSSEEKQGRLRAAGRARGKKRQTRGVF